MPDTPDTNPDANPSAPDVSAAHGEPDPTSLPPLTTAPVTVPHDDDDDEDVGARDGAVGGAANESLAGALAVSFKVLRVVLLGLILIFVFSGFFTVQQDEVAVRTRFGRIIPRGDGGDVLTADGGPYFRWPAPVGQVYRIPTKRQTLDIDRAFVFAAAGDTQNRGRKLTEINGGESLDPEADGYLITGDGGIIHARVTVGYQIRPESAADFVRNVADVSELDRNTDDPRAIFRGAENLIRQAVEQAIVQDVAGTPLDALLTTGRAPPTPAGQATAQATPAAGGAAPTSAPAAASDAPAERLDRPKKQAQAILDGLGSGIQLLDVTIYERTVPPSIRPAFDAVLAADQLSNRLRDDAQAFSQGRLTEAAGPAYPAVLAAVDVFEDADRTRDADPAFYAAAQTALNALLDGGPMGKVLPPLADALPPDDPRRDRLRGLATTYATQSLGGRAATTVSNAQRGVTQYLSNLAADADSFERLLANYRKAPDTVRQQLFLKTLSKVLTGADNGSEVLPGGQATLRLLFNEDPSLRNDREQQRRNEQAGVPPQGGQ